MKMHTRKRARKFNITLNSGERIIVLTTSRLVATVHIETRKRGDRITFIKVVNTWHQW